MDTLHSATDVRVLDGDRNAVRHGRRQRHPPPAGDRDGHCSTHNRWAMSIERTASGWQMSRLVIENRFWTGDRR